MRATTAVAAMPPTARAAPPIVTSTRPSARAAPDDAGSPAVRRATRVDEGSMTLTPPASTNRAAAARSEPAKGAIGADGTAPRVEPVVLGRLRPAPGTAPVASTRGWSRFGCGTPLAAPVHSAAS